MHLLGAVSGITLEDGLDVRIAALAARQYGVVSWAQLRALGMSQGALAYRIRTGRLHRIHRGVYAVGHPIVGREGRWMAAVLAVGDGAVLSHRSAAALLGIRPTSRASADVSTPRKAHPRPGIDVHRVSHLPFAEVAAVRAIPCTTVARTLMDLAEVVSARELEAAIEQTEIKRRFDLRAVHDALRRHRTRHGPAMLREVLSSDDGEDVDTRSRLEERFFALCVRAGLPRPDLNVPIALPDGTIATVDVLWRAQRLVVETDGRETHDTRAAFERDRRRDAQLVLAGYRVVRFTWRQVTREHASVIATLRGLLGLARRC